MSNCFYVNVDPSDKPHVCTSSISCNIFCNNSYFDLFGLNMQFQNVYINQFDLYISTSKQHPYIKWIFWLCTKCAYLLSYWDPDEKSNTTSFLASHKYSKRGEQPVWLCPEVKVLCISFNLYKDWHLKMTVSVFTEVMYCTIAWLGAVTCWNLVIIIERLPADSQ